MGNRHATESNNERHMHYARKSLNAHMYHPSSVISDRVGKTTPYSGCCSILSEMQWNTILTIDATPVQWLAMPEFAEVINYIVHAQIVPVPLNSNNAINKRALWSTGLHIEVRTLTSITTENIGLRPSGQHCWVVLPIC